MKKCALLVFVLSAMSFLAKADFVISAGGSLYYFKWTGVGYARSLPINPTAESIDQIAVVKSNGDIVFSTTAGHIYKYDKNLTTLIGSYTASDLKIKDIAVDADGDVGAAGDLGFYLFNAALATYTQPSTTPSVKILSDVQGGWVVAYASGEIAGFANAGAYKGNAGANYTPIDWGIDISGSIILAADLDKKLYRFEDSAGGNPVGIKYGPVGNAWPYLAIAVSPKNGGGITANAYNQNYFWTADLAAGPYGPNGAISAKRMLYDPDYDNLIIITPQDQIYYYVVNSQGQIVGAGGTIATISGISDIAGSAHYPELYQAMPNSRQTMYLNGAPHTDSEGRWLYDYDPNKSFMVRALYHVHAFDDQSGESGSRPTDFAAIKQAGFNTIETTFDLNPTFMQKLTDYNLELIYTPAREANAQAWASHPRILAWNVADEPESDGLFDQYPARIDFFKSERTKIRAIDPVRPVTVNTTAWCSGQNLPWWIQWHQISDISYHDNYPYDDWFANRQIGGPLTLTWTQGLPDSTQLAVSVTNQAKPVWLIVQAFDGGRWWFPQPFELRAMVYAGIIHGAVGINYFTYDNYLTRAVGILGISPSPLESYGSGRVATADEMTKMSQLWNEAAVINSQLETLTPWILSPTSSIEFTVYKKGASYSDAPIRCLLKKYNNEYRLLAVNIDRISLNVRFDFPDGVFHSIQTLFEGSQSPAVLSDNGVYDTTFGPMEVKVYRLLPACQTGQRYQADLTGDCKVDINDLLVLTGDWLNSYH